MPSPDAPPLVYVETNWLVAYLLPHDRHHIAAVELFNAAMNDECEMRIPYGAFLEAGGRAEKEMDDRLSDVNAMRNLLKTATDNGLDMLESARQGIESSELNTYFQRHKLKIRPLVDTLDRNPKLVRLHNPHRELETMVLIRPQTGFEADNRFDLYALASVIADRESTAPERPAVFCNINTKDFEPSASPKAKIKKDFYRGFHLLWWKDFDWRRAVNEWRTKVAWGTRP